MKALPAPLNRPCGRDRRPVRIGAGVPSRRPHGRRQQCRHDGRTRCVPLLGRDRSGVDAERLNFRTEVKVSRRPYSAKRL